MPLHADPPSLDASGPDDQPRDLPGLAADPDERRREGDAVPLAGCRARQRPPTGAPLVSVPY